MKWLGFGEYIYIERDTRGRIFKVVGEKETFSVEKDTSDFILN